MNILKNTLIVAMASTMLFACGKSGNHVHHDQMTDDHEMAAENMHDHADMAAEASENDATQAYLNLKDAFVDTDATMAAKAAKELAGIFHTTGFHEEAKLADEISNSDDIEAQRATFKTLSEKVYALASEQKIEFDTLYKQYCPMAFNNQGAYWLSKSKEIFNPYFGDKMLKCGRVEETLAKK